MKNLYHVTLNTACATDMTPCRPGVVESLAKVIDAGGGDVTPRRAPKDKGPYRDVTLTPITDWGSDPIPKWTADWRGLPIVSCVLAMESSLSDAAWRVAESDWETSFKLAPQMWTSPWQAYQPHITPWLASTLYPTANSIPPETLEAVAQLDQCVAYTIMWIREGRK